IWIVDIAPLQEFTAQTAAADVYLFQPKPGLQFGNRPIGGESTGHQIFQARSPAYGAEIGYWIGPNANIPAEGRGAQVQIAILDAGGDKVHTGTSAATPGIHRYQWDFRGQAPRVEPGPKTEEQIQDSLRAVERIEELLDSLEGAGSDRAQLEQTRDQILSGGAQRAFGGGGRGGAAPGGEQRDPNAWVERPGESFSQGGRGGGGGAFTPEMRIIMQAARDITGAGGFGGPGGGGGQASLADAGDYTVILKAGDREFRQTLTVIKGPDAGG
ncbi:MAG: hypothetical protein MUO50_03010, partial [Longimicrobiales bacterium]|nr:hypothetical protein [Longimicrobiales bacterium]